jgi:hypothetical protein
LDNVLSAVSDARERYFTPVSLDQCVLCSEPALCWVHAGKTRWFQLQEAGQLMSQGRKICRKGKIKTYFND